MSTLPTVFVSHGPPTLPFEAGPTRDALARLGDGFARPKGILCVSAHWETAVPTLSTATRPETIHDFYGFPEQLYALRYPAPGAPELAARAGELLAAAGLPVAYEERGLDHGAWVPLLLAWPEADIPVTQLSLQPARGPAHHAALGRALAPLRREGVLILASGNANHNLRALRRSAEPPDWAVAFDDWLAEAAGRGDAEALGRFLEEAPQARLNHPSDEHFLPLLVAAGAAEGEPGEALHRGWLYGALSMASYRFGAA